MKRQILFLIGMLMSISIFSQGVQTPLKEWSTVAGTQHFFYKNVVVTDANDNVYVAGATFNGAGNYDILVTKYNDRGQHVWTQQIDGDDGFQDFATALAIDSNGDPIITGAITNDTLYHMADVVVVKLNRTNGNVTWQKTYDGSGNAFDSGTDIIIGDSNFVYVVGAGYNGSFDTDFFILKFNSSGTQQWATEYDYSGMDDAAANIFFDSRLYVAGAGQTSSVDYDAILLEVNRYSGAIVGSTPSSGGSSSVYQVNDLTRDTHGNLYIAGVADNGSSDDMYLVKLDSNMVFQWEAMYDGSDGLDDMANGVKVDGSGNVYLAGFETSSSERKNWVLLQYDSGGSQQWVQEYNDTLDGDDEAMSLEIDANDEAIVTGYDSTALGSLDYLTVKYDNAGSEIWRIRESNLAGKDKALNMVINPDKSIVITGESQKPDGSYEYKTVKYADLSVIIPTDFAEESSQTGFDYFANMGQLIGTDTNLVPSVKFYSKSNSPALFFKDYGYSMVFAQIDTAVGADTLHRIDLTYFQANTLAKTYPLEEQKYFNNYYLGHTGDGVREVHSNKRLITTNLYSNIDVEYSSNQNGFKYYFIIKPGGNISSIKMDYTGASSFNLDGTTNALTINSTVGSITYARPVAYQVDNTNDTIHVTGWTPDWQTNGASNKYKFNSGAYDNTKPLIIVVNGITRPTSPASLTDGICWSTYIGGNDIDTPNGVDVDANGNQFTAGLTFSFDYPVGTAGPFPTHNIGYDGFLLKFRPDHVIEWGTYIGGSNNEGCEDVKVRKAGNGDPYIVGWTPSSNFPWKLKTGAHNDTTLGGSADGYIAQFSNSLGTQKWTTYFGGGGNDMIFSLDFDSSNRMYITGITRSSTGITSVVPGGAYTQSYGGGGDAFIARFPATDNYDWYTPYGGTGEEWGYSVAVDNSNRVFIYGTTTSPTGAGALPTTNPAGAGDYYDNTLNGLNDAFIAKFSSSGAVQWATYIGGDSTEFPGMNALAFNKVNDIYLGGGTSSPNFPLVNSGGFFDNTLNEYDGYILRIDGTTLDTALSTFFGASVYSPNLDVSSIAINGDDEVFIAGGTDDVSFPVFQQGSFYYQDTLSGATYVPDAFLMTLNEADNQILGTYFGGYELGYQERIADLVVDDDYLFAVGRTFSSDTNGVKRFPLWDPGAPAYYDSTYNGGSYDGFITKFCIGTITGINEAQASSDESGFIVFPNPTSDQLNIRLAEGFDEIATVELYSIDGKLVNSYILGKQQVVLRIDVSALTNGLYFVRIRNAEFNSTVKFSKSY